MFQKKMMNRMNRMKVSDLFPYDWIMGDTNSLFYLLKDETNFPLVKDFIKFSNYITLTEDYFIGHSNDKFISPLFSKFVEHYSSSEIDIKVLMSSKLASLVYNRFGEKWKKIYDALMTEYNPLENYSMEEERTPDLSFEDTENVNTDVTSERETHASNSYKGFNADVPALLNKTDGDETNTTTGASANNETHKVSTHTGTETLTRAGNIGVTTSQQMLESEFKVRQYDFYKMMYNDIDGVLCLSIY